LRASFRVAAGLGTGTKLSPLVLKLVARLRFVDRAPLLYLFLATFGPALPPDVEFRCGVCDRGGLEGREDNDRQESDHFVSPGLHQWSVHHANLSGIVKMPEKAAKLGAMITPIFIELDYIIVSLRS
jgi:hypothetical protein